jgi:hypothetical protein
MMLSEKLAVASIAFLLAGFDSFNRPLKDMMESYRATRTFGGAAYAGHETISRQCLANAGFSAPILTELSERTSDIDASDFLHSEQYEPRKHFDRRLGWTHREAFYQGLQYYWQNVAEAVNSFRLGDWDHAAQILPRALHAQEDLFAHSNFVDLPPEAQARLAECFVSPVPCLASIPGDEVDRALALLQLTGYHVSGNDAVDGPERDPYLPTGDAYPHGKLGQNGYAKDSAHHGKEAELVLPGGETKYRAAVRWATQTCSNVLQAFVRQCSALIPGDWEDRGPVIPPEACDRNWAAFRKADVPRDPDRERIKKALGKGAKLADAAAVEVVGVRRAPRLEDVPFPPPKAGRAAVCADAKRRDVTNHARCVNWCEDHMPVDHGACARTCSDVECVLPCNYWCSAGGCKDWCHNVVKDR